MARKGSTVFVLAGLIGLGALPLTGDTKPALNRHQKAYYLSQDAVAFVRPGILFKITAGQVAPDGTITATFQITDPKGLPLDMDGVTTPGPVKVGMTLATIYNDHVSEEYASHVLQTVTDPKTGITATQRR
jgi:hypothetical protein